MGEPRPSPATAPGCQPLTEQPGKDIQSKGQARDGWLMGQGFGQIR